MQKFIPYEKLSKKKRRELNAAHRTTWAMNPVTRKPANPRAYNRKTARNWKDDSNSVPFVHLFDRWATKDINTKKRESSEINSYLARKRFNNVHIDCLS